MIITPFGFMATQAAGGDPDANAFISAAGITDSTQQSAIQTLVTNLKSAGVWTKCQAIYPFVGGTATAHKFNLKDPRDLDAAYRLTFNGTWTHDANGAASGNTASDYADTHWDVTIDSSNDAHHSYKYATIPSTDNCGYSGQGGSPFFVMGTCPNLEWFDGNSTQSNLGSRTGGYAQGILRTTSTNVYFYSYLNSSPGSGFAVRATKTNAVGTITSSNYYIGTINNSTGFSENDTYGFFTLGDTMTQAEFVDLYDASQTFNTTLGRNV